MNLLEQFIHDSGVGLDGLRRLTVDTDHNLPGGRTRPAFQPLQREFRLTRGRQGHGGHGARIEVEHVAVAQRLLRAAQHHEQGRRHRHGEDHGLVLDLGVIFGPDRLVGSGGGGLAVHGIADQQGLAAGVALQGDAQGGRAQAGAFRIGGGGLGKILRVERVERVDGHFDGTLAGARVDG